MGWWKCDLETGQISNERPTGAGESDLVNAIPGRDAKEDFYCGDWPADIMGEALKGIAEVYQKHWGRPPAIEEIDAVFAFCTGKLREGGS